MKTPPITNEGMPGWFCMSPVPNCFAYGPENGDDAPDVCPKCGKGPVAVADIRPDDWSPAEDSPA